MKIHIIVLLCISCILITPFRAWAYVRADVNLSNDDGPHLSALDLEAHDVSNVYLIVSNRGQIGLDLETGHGAGFFPSNTANNYVFGTGLWFGANYDADGDGNPDKVFVQGYDPLGGDSEFREGRGDQDKDDPLTRIFDSTDPADLAEWPPRFSDPGSGDPIVYSDQDLVTTYTTQGKTPIFGNYQLPLEVDQRSMAFMSPDSMAQVIFFVFDVENTGDDVLTDAWIGYDSDMDIGVVFSDDLSSLVLDWVKPGGDTVTLDMEYAWDSDFHEINFTGDPGFIGISLVLGPGNPDDGMDNDGDGLVDESPDNGVDDDGDGYIDEWDEVDEIGLVNYSKHCNPPTPCPVLDPMTDEQGYDLMSCNTPESPVTCLESTQPGDVRFMLSSGPFDWQPGRSEKIVLAMVFANAVGHPASLDFVGDPPRPDPNDPALAEFMRVAELARELFPTLFPPVGIGDEPDGPNARLPRACTLAQNYPNPFNPVTTIRYEIAGDGGYEPVDLTIFDLRGRRVRGLFEGSQPPGRYEVQWDGRDDHGRALSSGAYLYRLKAGNFVSTRRMNMVK